jgi:integrase
MRIVGDRADGDRLRALIVLLWRAGLRISEALSLQESDLDRARGAVLDRRGKGGKRREVGMDRWAWDQLEPWLQIRRQLPVGALLCVLHGPTTGRHWEASAALRAPSATRPPRSQPGRQPVPNAAHLGIRGRAAISPAYPTREPWDHQHLPARHR